MRNLGAYGAAACALLAWDTASARDVPEHAEPPSAAATAAEPEMVVIGQRLTSVGIGDKTGFGVLGEREVLNTPFSVTAFTEALIENSVAQNLTDVLVRDPSLSSTVNAAGFRDEFDIRGFLVRRSTFLYDGVPGLVATDGYIGIGNLDRVEVFRGVNAFNSGAAVFGGVGGTINFAPKRPVESDITEATVGYVTDQPFGALDFSRRFGPGGQVGMRLTSYFADGGAAVDGLDRLSENYALYLDWRPTNNTYFAVEGTRYRSRSDFYRDDIFLAGGVSLPATPDLRTNYSQPYAFIEQSGVRIYAKGRWDFARNWSLSAAGGRLDGDNNNGYISAFGLITNDAGALTQFPSQSGQPNFDTSGVQATIDGKFSFLRIDHKVVFSATLATSQFDGTFAVGEQVQSNLFSPVYFDEVSLAPADPDVFSDSVLTQSVLYEGAALGGRLVGLAGVRRVNIKLRSSFSDYDETQLTPFGAVYVKPAANVTLYASYTQGLERGETAPLAAVNAREQLVPAVSEQYEVGAKAALGELLFTFAAFDISRPVAFLNPQNLFTADGDQTHRGIELQASGRLFKQFRIISGVTYLDARLQNGNPLIEGNRPVGVPQWATALYGEYDAPMLSGLTLTGGLNYQSGQFVDVTNIASRRADGWITGDVGARYAFDIKAIPIALRFAVSNIANSSYWGVSTISGLQLSAPRTFRLSLTTNF